MISAESRIDLGRRGFRDRKTSELDGREVAGVIKAQGKSTERRYYGQKIEN